MPIVEHQYLHYKNVLCFEMQLDYGEIEDFAQRIDYSLDVLDLSRDGKIVITQKSPFLEFLIPVDKQFSSSKHYRYKPEFKLVNAIRTRHYGSFDSIQNKVEELKKYIQDQSFLPATPPYFIVQDIKNKIYDVYIGINESIILWYFYGVSKLTRILNYGGKSYDQTENKVTAQANAIRSTGFSYDSECGSCHAGSG